MVVQEQKEKPVTGYETIEWVKLIPKEDLDALMNPPEYLNDIQDGSEQDQFSNQVQNAIEAASNDTYQQALVSTKVLTEMNGKKIKIPGFIVPLEFDDEQNVIQFFLVPYFGACIHEPPPPPNQMIYVTYPKGLKVDDLYQAFWISGKLQTALFEDQLGTAAYTMNMDEFELF
ncbi:DUF3299 domain-containing protein [Saccharobesus litoralis]|uniref:DUF3299 domain-containing protein n=2 Tax=Saccharobesus litoralis TaxID=2172099 RepID=A0A2S0VXI2_9ALTE|nr:DUF3299 domain-containing protein [Saccharobesus litoralis]